jgi:hypothetical protein
MVPLAKPPGRFKLGAPQTPPTPGSGHYTGKKMKVSNIRLGHATNSSSLHSLIFLPPNQKPSDDYSKDGCFGWEFFTCFSHKAKMDYLTMVLQSNLRHFDPQVTEYIIRSVCTDTKFFPRGYIDHQSIITLPRKFGSDYIDEDFFLDLTNYILQPNLAILGGNDNTHEKHPLATNAFRLPITDKVGTWYCRKDGMNDEWVLYNSNSGDKIRFSFNRKQDFTTNTTKAEAPELVDIKITDYCPYQCPYCYQDSKPTGKQNTGLSLHNIITTLADLKVFEVAIGGGEPTLSKNFAGIISYCKKLGITPNFSTKNLDFFRDPKNYKLIEGVGGIAISVEPYTYRKTIAELYSCLNYHEYPKEQISIQIIIGGDGFCTDCSLVNIAGSMYNFGFDKLTLLGYKLTGRAKGTQERFDKNKLFNTIKEISSKYWIKIGVDTQFIKMFKEQIQEQIPSYLYHEEEGKFSCYIDAVEGKIGASSYCRELIDLPVRLTPEIILEHFKSF